MTLTAMVSQMMKRSLMAQIPLDADSDDDAVNDGADAYPNAGHSVIRFGHNAYH